MSIRSMISNCIRAVDWTQSSDGARKQAVKCILTLFFLDVERVLKFLDECSRQADKCFQVYDYLTQIDVIKDRIF